MPRWDVDDDDDDDDDDDMMRRLPGRDESDNVLSPPRMRAVAGLPAMGGD